MNILAYIDQLGITKDQLKTTEAIGYNLKLGQTWEDLLAIALTEMGLPAYRPPQRFRTASVYKLERETFYGKDGTITYYPQCDLKRKGREVIPDYPDLDKSLLRPHQRDVMVKVGKVKRLSVEVKALTPDAFKQWVIWIGCLPKWDEKKFKVDAVVLINQETGQAWVCPPMSEWKKDEGTDGKKCYAVQRNQLTLLAAWIDFIKDSLDLP